MVQTQLEPGDKVVIYSDGLTEAENAERRVFRYRAAARRACATTPSCDADRACTRRCWTRSTEFTEGGVIRDDITALVLEYLPA